MPDTAQLTPAQIRFVQSQPLFFVATAARQGRVNLSPKGMDTLTILAPDRIAWLNLTGSGNETAAHLRDSPRMTLMFVAFAGQPMILRIYGQAHTTHPDDPDWPRMAALLPDLPGARQIFALQVDLVQTSCGTGVPLMDYRGQRGPDQLLPFYRRMGPDGVRDYWRRKNTLSLDGQPTGILPGGRDA